MTFSPAIADQRFVLEHIVRLGDFSAEGADLVEPVLTGVADLAAGEWAALDRLGDTIGAQLTAAGVKMPDGFVAAYRAYVAGGWGTIGAPKEFGGGGLPASLSAAALETLGSANMSLALCPTLTVAAVEALTHHGSAQQQAAYLPRLVTGEWTGTMNLTEPQAGSDVGALTTRADPVGDGRFRITGTKIFISFGDHDLAENIVHMVLARTPSGPIGTKGISLFLVSKYRLNPDGTPGEFNDVRVASIEQKMGLHGSPTCVLNFGDQNACIGELVGEEHGGMRAMFTMMNNARLNVGLQGVQVAERATQRASAYASERIQGYRDGVQVPIMQHPDVRRMLLRMHAQTQAARSLVYYAFGQLDRATAGDKSARSRLELLTPLAKAHATDIGEEVASLGIQVHGGMGYVEETGAAQHYRDARIARIYEGTNGIQAADLVGRKLSSDNGQALFAIIEEMRRGAVHPQLVELISACDAVGRNLLQADSDDRLAASYPFLTMLAVAVCGWLMEQQWRIAKEGPSGDHFLSLKSATTRFFVEQIVPEAVGLKAAAMAKADILYSVSADALTN